MQLNTLSRAIATAILGGAFAATGAIAQETQRVEITGSSIKRIEGETAAPVQVIRREDIERSGATNMEQVMRSVSAMVSSNSTAASSSSGATTGGISEISMRGLTAERTLILIDGKRTAPYGSPSSSVSVDIDSIPLAAIDRVEILKDGASAIYGSDAIAGVVNFILRKDYQGVELAAGYGAATKDGKASTTNFSLVGGITSDNYHVMVLGSYQKDNPLFGRDRDFASTGIRLDKDNVNVSSRTFPANISIPDFGVFNPAVNGATGENTCAPTATYIPEFSSDICWFDTAPFVGLIPETERTSLMVTGGFRVSDAFEGYGSFSWNQKKAKTLIQPSPIDSGFGIPFTLTTASPFYPTTFVQGITGGTTPDLSVRFRPFIIGNRDLDDTADAFRFVGGARGLIGGWDYDTNILHATSQVKEQLNGGFFRIADEATGPGVVPLLSGQVLGADGQPLWVNPFGDNSDEVIAAARATNYVGQAFKTKTSLTGVQGKISKELAQLSGGGLGFAVGGELRREGYNLDSAPALATGNISGYGGNFVSIDTSRKVYGIFAEVNAPVLKGVELDAALRYDKYGGTSSPLSPDVAASSLAGLGSDPSGDPVPQSLIDQIALDSTGDAPSFGKATGKLGLRYQASPQVLLRGTWSTGFRAPALLDLYGPVQAGVSAVQNDPKNCTGANAGNPSFCATQFNVYSGGNSKLKPETSRSFTLGFVVEPAQGLSVGFDYFDTQVKDLIQVLADSFLLENEDQYQDRVTRGPSGEIVIIDQRLENLGKTIIKGLDWDIRGNLRTDVGRFALSWSGTYMSTWKTQNPDGSYENAIGTTSAAVSGFIPRIRHSTSLTWSVSDWAITSTYNWQSRADDICGNLLQDDFGDCPAGFVLKTKPYETMDAQVEYSGIKGLGIALGVRNLFDADPPYVNGAGGAFQSGYDPTVGDPRGRFAYVNLKYKF
jgi:iron complex outermembrane recepter protein